MTRFAPYPRRAYSNLFKAWARRNKKSLALLTFGLLVLLAFETAVILTLFPDGRFQWWFLGGLQAALIATALHFVNAAFLAHERQAIWQLRGAWGEEATRDELRRAKKKRLIWGWVDSINLQAGDLDHLALTRSGGIVAIDSKWRSDGADTTEMARSAARVKLRADAVTRSLLKPERGAHRARLHSAAVTPLIVIWGPVQDHVPESFQIDGIEFVGGRRLLDRLATLTGEPVDRDAAADALTRLKDFRANTWAPASNRS
ncbi:nuclease-related domain-containing protein [Nocardioides sambongensis]|uniref:nuclease-related domain-containing protein n=1 Tax=Nocardioides sambongensis TaxID=2589074 RepID=UPI00112A2DC8|nr:NERD domain-containing protein [Nocardioides sambongensis]